MLDLLTDVGQLAVPVLVVLAGGSSVLGMWLKSRESRKAGVIDADVTERKNSGDLALEISRDLRDRLVDVEDERDKDRERLTQLERVNLTLARDVETFRAALVDATLALDDMVEWEKAGAKPPAPHRLSTITWRLKRAISKE